MEEVIELERGGTIREGFDFENQQRDTLLLPETQTETHTYENR